jgi:ATP-dependent helicase HrpA
VLATNVAETSLTVPGIRYVIDAGLARVKRYSYRNKVEQLQVEPISQAAANQRAGRCGRVANGICIRLYDERAFNDRPRFTDPEILRSSLAGVILRMKSLHLGQIEDFPFLEEPPRKAIADGYALLSELGAVDDDNELTDIGRQLAKLPLDPRVGRMILEAVRAPVADRGAGHRLGAVGPGRARPPAGAGPGRRREAQALRRREVRVHGLPEAVEVDRGGPRPCRWPGAPDAQAQQPPAGAAPARPFRQPAPRARMARHPFAAAHRGGRAGLAAERAPATYEQVHLAMLAGLLGNIGCKSDDEDWYLGARGIKFWRHPGAHLSKKPGRWLVAAELVDTTRLFGRGLAAIEPTWIPEMAGHLLKKQLLEPHWEKKAGEVVALERATLYGIVVYNNKRVNFGQLDPRAAREIFIREALVEGEIDTRLPFLAHNQKLIKQVQELEHKARRQDVLVDDELIHAFYDQQLPAEVCSTASLEKWFRERGQAPAAPAAAVTRRADAARGRGHHHRVVPAHGAPGRHRLRGSLPARAGRRQGRPDGDGADLRAEPGQRRALRMAGARHAEGQGAGAGEEPAPAPALAPAAAARVRRRFVEANALATAA